MYQATLSVDSVSQVYNNTGASVDVTGISMTASVGSVLTWEQVAGVNNTWSEINTGTNNSWSDVDLAA